MRRSPGARFERAVEKAPTRLSVRLRLAEWLFDLRQLEECERHVRHGFGAGSGQRPCAAAAGSLAVPARCHRGEPAVGPSARLARPRAIDATCTNCWPASTNDWAIQTRRRRRSNRPSCCRPVSPCGTIRKWVSGPCTCAMPACSTRWPKSCEPAGTWKGACSDLRQIVRVGTEQLHRQREAGRYAGRCPAVRRSAEVPGSDPGASTPIRPTCCTCAAESTWPRRAKEQARQRFEQPSSSSRTTTRRMPAWDECTWSRAIRRRPSRRCGRQRLSPTESTPIALFGAGSGRDGTRRRSHQALRQALRLAPDDDALRRQLIETLLAGRPDRPRHRTTAGGGAEGQGPPAVSRNC